MNTLLVLLLVGWAQAEEFFLAKSCDKNKCQLPNCRCSSADIPGGLNVLDVPQFVTITFDDAINFINVETYRKSLYNRFNSNRCTAGATFYISHEYTDYVLVNELYRNGFEIALHSISHQTPSTYWATGSYEDMVKEFGEQKQQMARFANIPESDIRGIRHPFLQMSGNNSFQMMKDFGLLYDCSWPTNAQTNPGLWPYTLDYTSSQDCPIQPCPSASFPGVWIQPMVSWSDLNGVSCSMVDSCYHVPDRSDADAWYEFILNNFLRHYTSNRAPFGFYIHEWYLRAYPAVEEALVRFMDLINHLPDTFMVNSVDVIEWVQKPLPIDDYLKKPCRSNSLASCSPTRCGPLRGHHNNLDYWLSICTGCPRTYPWLGNPLGTR